MNLNNLKSLNNKQLIIASCAVMLAIAVLISILLFRSSELSDETQDSTIPKQNPSPSSNTQSVVLSVTNLQPPALSPLPLGKAPAFVISFNRSVNLGEVQIDLKEVNRLTNQEKILKINPETYEDGKSILAQTKDLIVPYAEYTLQISTGGNLLVNAVFLSDSPRTPPAINNNPELKSFLPYETDTFLLNFNPELNLYTFSYLYNPSSPDSAQTQYEKARAKAEDFIRSTGVNINTLNIDWES